MRQNDYPRFDLNLLAVFDALMQERHVGRAGERLGLTQPAVSHALGRLRALVGDRLFVKHARGVMPTPRAEALAQSIGPALAALRASLGMEPDFHPATARRTIAIGSSDHIEISLLPAVMARLRSEAPHIDVRFRAVTPDDVAQAMRRREIDLAIGPLIASPESVVSTPLFSDRLVLVARKGHPDFTAPLTIAAFADLPQLLVSQRGDAAGIIDEALRELGLKRRIALTVPHFFAAPFLIEATDLVVLLPERLAHALRHAATTEIHACPIELTPWVVGVALPQESASDPCLAWFVALLADVTRQSSARP